MAAPVVACPSCGKKNRVPVAAKGQLRCAECHTDLPWIVDADDGNFRAAVDSRRLVIVDLWASWCGPCRAVAPILERIANDYAGKVKLVKVDVDRNQRVAADHNARSIPMILFFRNGEKVDTVVGAQGAHVFREVVDRHL